MSDFTQFDGRLFISYSHKASELLKESHWVLTKGFEYKVGDLNSGISVSVPCGFLSNGANIPFVMRWLIERMGKHSQAAFLHDYLCETYRYNDNGVVVVIDRKTIDKIFIESLRVLEVERWKIFIINSGVTLYRLLTNPQRPKTNPLKEQLEEEYRTYFSAMSGKP